MSTVKVELDWTLWGSDEEIHITGSYTEEPQTHWEPGCAYADDIEYFHMDGSRFPEGDIDRKQKEYIEEAIEIAGHDQLMEMKGGPE